MEKLYDELVGKKNGLGYENSNKIYMTHSAECAKSNYKEVSK